MRTRRLPLLHVAVDQGSGPAVVLIHGIASSYVTFENVVPLLDDHRVIAVDLLGFGGSPAPPASTYTLEEHVDYLSRTLSRLRIPEPFVLVGHSMGSLIASRYASTRSSKLRGLVLVSPPVYLPPDGRSRGEPSDRTAATTTLAIRLRMRCASPFTLWTVTCRIRSTIRSAPGTSSGSKVPYTTWMGASVAATSVITVCVSMACSRDSTNASQLRSVTSSTFLIGDIRARRAALRMVKVFLRRRKSYTRLYTVIAARS